MARELHIRGIFARCGRTLKMSSVEELIRILEGEDDADGEFENDEFNINVEQEKPTIYQSDMSSIIIDKLKQIDKASRDDRHHSITASSSAESTCSEKRRKAKGDRESSDQQSSDQTSSVLRTDESEYYEAYHVAKLWAGKLRKLSRCQKLYAEKAIHDILFEAQLGHLRKSSVKINDKTVKKRTPSATSHSRTSFTSKSTDSAGLEHSHSDQVMAASSEVLIAESYPVENGLFSSESRPENDINSKQRLSKVSANGVHTRNQTFIVATTAKTIREPSQTRRELLVEDNEQPYAENSTISNAATNTPDCILKQLSRYIRDCYDNCKSYLPPATQQ